MATLIWSQETDDPRPHIPFVRPYKTMSQSLGDVYYTSLSSVSALTVVAYDLLTNLDDEVLYIWSSSNTWCKWMYFFIRYIPLIVESIIFGFFKGSNVFSQLFCEDSAIVESILFEVVVLAVETILIIRVYILYGCSRKLLWSMLVLFALSIVVSIVGMFIATNTMHYDGQCFVTSAPKTLILPWVAPIAFDTFLFILTLIKLVESLREGLGKQPIFHVIVRDSTWAYALVCMIMILNAVSYVFFSSTVTCIFYGWAFSILSFTGSHVLLNIRKIASQSYYMDGSVETTGFSSQDLDSPVCFADLRAETTLHDPESPVFRDNDHPNP